MPDLAVPDLLETFFIYSIGGIAELLTDLFDLNTAHPGNRLNQIFRKTLKSLSPLGSVNHLRVKKKTVRADSRDHISPLSFNS